MVEEVKKDEVQKKEMVGLALRHLTQISLIQQHNVAHLRPSKQATSRCMF